MGYVKISNTESEYSGESFTQVITKKDDSVWSATEIAVYSMVDKVGAVLATGSLIKSPEGKELGFTIGKSITGSLKGAYKVIVDLRDSGNAEISDVIAEYNIVYSARTA